MNRMPSISRFPNIIETKKKTSKTTLLERIGGLPALDAVIDGMYFRVMADDDLLLFFGQVDLQLLKAHQRQFMSMAFSNKPLSQDVIQKRLRKAHRRLFAKGLNVTHFDRIVGHLSSSLSDLLVDRSVVLEVVSCLRPYRSMFERNSKDSKKSTKFQFKKWTKRQGAKLFGW